MTNLVITGVQPSFARGPVRLGRGENASLQFATGAQARQPDHPRAAHIPEPAPRREQRNLENCAHTGNLG